MFKKNQDSCSHHSGQLTLLKTDPVSFFAASRKAGMRSYGVFPESSARELIGQSQKQRGQRFWKRFNTIDNGGVVTEYRAGLLFGFGV